MKRQLLVYSANADGTYSSGVNFATTNSNNLNSYPSTFLVGDVNGDGRDDYIVKWRDADDTVRFLTYLGTATGTFIAPVRTVPNTDIPFYNFNPAS